MSAKQTIHCKKRPPHNSVQKLSKGRSKTGSSATSTGVTTWDVQGVDAAL